MFVSGGAARLVGMQLYRRISDELGTPQGRDAATFVDFMARFAAAQGDRVDVTTDGDTFVVRQTGWKLMDGVTDAHPAVLDIWARLIDGALAAHNPRLTARRDGLTWRIG